MGLGVHHVWLGQRLASLRKLLGSTGRFKHVPVDTTLCSECSVFVHHVLYIVYVYQ